MTRWTKHAAIDRKNQNLVLQEVLRLEPRLDAIIKEAQGQRRTKGYNRIRKYIELKKKALPLVGSLAEKPGLRKSKYYDAVIRTIDDLLPPDEADIYPESKPQPRLRKPEMWVTVSDCPPERSEEFWRSEKEAKTAIDAIDKLGCGGNCLGKYYHYIRAPKSAVRH